MTAKEFGTWAADMGWCNSEIARRLHITRATVIRYKAAGALLHIALAAAALAHGLQPWSLPVCEDGQLRERPTR